MTKKVPDSVATKVAAAFGDMKDIEVCFGVVPPDSDFECVSWVWRPSESTHDYGCPVMVDRARQMNGSVKFAVRQTGACLNKSGNWEYEPMPSSRDDAFLERCRFDSFDDASKAISLLKPTGRFK